MSPTPNYLLELGGGGGGRGARGEIYSGVVCGFFFGGRVHAGWLVLWFPPPPPRSIPGRPLGVLN